LFSEASLKRSTAVMGFEVPRNGFQKKKALGVFKISKFEALKNGFSPDCSPP